MSGWKLAFRTLVVIGVLAPWRGATAQGGDGADIDRFLELEQMAEAVEAQGPSGEGPSATPKPLREAEATGWTPAFVQQWPAAEAPGEAQPAAVVEAETPEAAPAAGEPPAAGLEEAAAVEPAAAEPPAEAVAAGPADLEGDRMSSLALRDRQLQECRAEIERLKDVIRRIWEANHREKVNSHYNMGCVYKACRLYRNAEAELLKALQLDASDPGVHFNLGVLYDDDLKNKERARYHYKRFLELAPNDRDAPRVHEWLLSLD
jgi:tetratricopeptide (TPR) repeat protein